MSNPDQSGWMGIIDPPAFGAPVAEWQAHRAEIVALIAEHGPSETLTDALTEADAWIEATPGLLAQSEQASLTQHLGETIQQARQVLKHKKAKVA